MQPVEKRQMDEQLDRIRKAYDLTVRQFRDGIDPYDDIPDEIRDSDFYRSLTNASNLNSASPDIMEYLSPQSGMRFLDAGCSAHLANYNLGNWLSTYYGIDISPALIKAMNKYVGKNNIPIGGLYVTDISTLPFDDNFFDIAAGIGVLEYCSMDYISQALQELHRVMKSDSRIVLDIPNATHPHAGDMQRLEEYLGRPVFLHSSTEFEALLKPMFGIDSVNNSRVMLKYFIRNR